MDNLKRVMEIKNGDIFHVWTVNKNVEYEDDLFYEVIVNGIDDLGNTIWKRNGNILTMNEVNRLYRKPLL
jgi:hypothetical protein